jgi:hypothetical protein
VSFHELNFSFFLIVVAFSDFQPFIGGCSVCLALSHNPAKTPGKTLHKALFAKKADAVSTRKVKKRTP